MNWFINLKIGVKLVMAFVVVALIAGVVGLTGIISIRTIEKADTEMYELNTEPLVNIADARVAYQQVRVNLRDIILDNRANSQKYLDNLKQLDQSMAADIGRFEQTLRTERGRKEIAVYRAAVARFQPTRDQVISLAGADQDVQALALIRGAGAQAQAIEDSLGKLSQMKIELAKAKAASNRATARAAERTMIAFILIGVGLALGLGVWIARLISRPVHGLVASAKQIAGGDLDVAIAVTTKDEIGALAEAFQVMSANVNEVIANIGTASEQVAAGARHVSASSMSLSQGATEQASAIEELTASLEEMSAQTRQNAANANQASELAETVSRNASAGNQQMREMLRSMEQINESSANISKIIKVIDEIAFQTNILALNAAVEAARAGQHGKGFAVVAEEVRNLAARSADAAKETTVMIEDSVKNVTDGTRIAEQTAVALDRIVGDIAKVTGLVGDIAIASNEQATGIAQINQGVMQVSQVVQTNSATSEESAAASEELSSQAQLLKEQVGRFKLKRQNAGVQLGDLNPEIIRVLRQMSAKPEFQTPAAPTPADPAPVKTEPLAIETEYGKY